MPDRSKLSELEELSLEIQRKVSAELHRRINRVLTVSQAMMLWKLDKLGPQKITALAEHMSITPGAITSLSDKLIANGYANRVNDPQDRRVVKLEITPDGRELISKLRADVKHSFAILFAGLSDHDLDHLVRIYQQVLKNMANPNLD